MKRLKIIILIIVCVALAVGYYYYLSNHTRADSEARKEESSLSEVEEILTDDIESDYPPTPREVVKYYNRIITCYYSGACSEEQIEALAKIQRCLLDEELLENNPWEEFLQSVNAEILDYQTNETKILDSTVDSSSEIEYNEVDGRECAYIVSEYLLKKGTGTGKLRQQYVLREDEEKHWKIVAFQIAEDDGEE